MLNALKTLEDRRHDDRPVVRAEATATAPAIDAAPEAPPAIAAATERCFLPTTPQVADHYFDLAARIGEQLSANYCNVLCFASVDHSAESSFAMTQVAQAFALQSPGRVLLVDGDLRCGRLSKAVCPSGAGIIEVMLGIAHWPQVIHPTNVQLIDFVGSGHAQVPTFDRPEFGWGALRPNYRAVLIGLAPADEPESQWLAGRCDAVYLVLSKPHTKRQAATETLGALRSAGANVLGSIVANN